MNISFDWLQSHIQIDEEISEISDKLTFSGLEVEAIVDFESIKGSLEGIVIGEVLTCTKHPNADKLSITTVDTGEAEPVQIVCGAPNVATGQKVVVATVGSVLYPEGEEAFKIKKSKIRGEISLGMICAEDELGLGKSHDGIIVLETSLKNGSPASAYFQVFRDKIIEIGLTPNRADAISHLGVARDIQALYKGHKVKQTTYTIPSPSKNNPVEVIVDDANACPRYTGICIDGIKVKESPQWLKDRLKSIGLTPKNNVIDITNFILHDLGQPLHAFDRKSITSNKVRVTTVAKNILFTALDDTEHKLLDTDLVICNDKEPMCLAGVTGGLASGVTDSTSSIFLESAYFDADVVRKTSLAHGLKTDSSFRFERGTDPNMPIYALQKAVNLILDLAGGEVVSEVIDIYPNPIENFKVEVSIDRIQRLIGKSIEKARMIEILKSLEIEILENKGDELLLSVPPYRVDVQREADIAEEVLRIYGYENIKLTNKLASAYLAPSSDTDKREDIRVKLSETLAGLGYFEITTNSLTRPSYTADLDAYPKERNVQMLNPLSEDLSIMRQTLLFTGLEVISNNIRRQNTNLSLFEFGKTYQKLGTAKYNERNILALYVTGNEQEESWQTKQKKTDFHTLSKAVQAILIKTNITGYSQTTVSDNQLFSQNLVIEMNGKVLISAGIVEQKLLKKTEVKQAVMYAEIDLDELYKISSKELTYSGLSKFPAVRRDLSVVVDKKVSFEEIKELTQKVERKLIKQINVFDQYSGDKLEKGKKSYSISYILQDQDKTLNDKIIDKTMEKLIKNYEKELDALIRR